MTLPMLAKTEEGKEGKGAQKANTGTKEWKKEYGHWFRQSCGQQEAWCGVGMARQQFKKDMEGVEWGGREQERRMVRTCGPMM